MNTVSRNSDPEIEIINTKGKVDEDLDRHLFSLQEWDNFWEIFANNPGASFSVKSINVAIHNILWSRLCVWEFFSDRYWTIYSTWEFKLARELLKKERVIAKEFIETIWILPSNFICNSISELSRTITSLHPEELKRRYEKMMCFPNGIDTLEDWENCLDDIGRFRLPTPIEKCIGIPWNHQTIVWPWKSAQIVISAEKWTNNIAWVCMTYKTNTLEEAFKNELNIHYGWRYGIIKRAMETIYDDLDRNWIMVFPVIGMIPKYTSIRSMMRMMRDWAKELISDEFAMVPWIAEMDMTNNFFDLCSRQLSVTPLTLMDHHWDPISAVNKRLDYCSTVVTFRAIAAIEKARKWINSVIPRKSFNLRENE